MRIAVLCPIGPLDHFGYQYNYMITVRSYAEFADRVYMYSSSRNRANVDRILAAFPNVTYISDERTWFSLDEYDHEIFRVTDFERNNDIALARAKADGMDCAVHIHVNQYIEHKNGQALKKIIKSMLEKRHLFEWVYRRYQLANKLFDADVRHPWLLNLTIDNPFFIRADAIHHKDGNERYCMELGNFDKQNSIAIIDAGMEMTLQDLADVRDFTRGYVEKNPDANPQFDWSVYKPYYVNKFNKKNMSNDLPDIVGQEIARENRSDFLSNLFLASYKPKSLKHDWLQWLKRIAPR